MASSKSSQPLIRLGKKQQGWLGFFLGLAIGLFIALLVFLQGAGLRTNLGLGTNGDKPAEPQKSGANTNQATTVPLAKAPKFDFYTILPESEVKVTEPDAEKNRTSRPAAAPERSEPSGAADKPTAERQSTPAQGQISLQVGSFQRPEDAERTKAKLALIGISADVHSVRVNGNETWFRVMAGPYNDTAQLDTARKRLEENNISFMIVKLKS